MNRTVLLARLWELCERLTNFEDIATILIAIAVIEAEGGRLDTMHPEVHTAHHDEPS